MCEMFQRRRSTRGFTLIELLIVVLIIAILAAIAIPNFLEYQTRAKVARVKTDLRTLTLAIEAYCVDQGDYPLTADEMGRPIAPYPPVGFGPEAFETRLSVVVTTPIAYLVTLPDDPFAAKAPRPEDPRIMEGNGYHYGNRNYALANDGVEGRAMYDIYVLMLGQPPQVVRYYLSSHGPDLDHDDDEDPTDEHGATAYDPTNGTNSSGDVVYFGPSLGYGR
jgi:type II secretion system protein G